MRFLLNIIFFIFCLSFVVNQAVAQPKKTYTTAIGLNKAYNCLARAQRFQVQSRADSAKLYYQQALEIFHANRKWSQVLSCLNDLTNLCQQNFDRTNEVYFSDSALSLLSKKAMLLAGRKSSPEDLYATAETYLLQGRIQMERDELTKALSFSNESLTILRRLPAVTTHQETRQIKNRYVRNYYELGKIYMAAGDYKQARSMFERAMKITRQDALLCQAMGELNLHIGSYDNAYNYLQLSLKKQQKNDAATKATTCDLLGLLHMDKGAFDSAIVYHQKALDIWTRITPKKHYLPARALSHLGIAYQKKGNYLSAMEFQETALNLILEPDNDDKLIEKAEICDNLGVTYTLRGDIDQALYYHNSALSDYRNRLSENHPLVATCLYNLGNAHYGRKDYAKAESYFRQSMEIAGKSLGQHHPLFAALYNSLGMIYRLNNQLEAAQAYFRKALSIYVNVLHQKSHPYLARVYDNLSSVTNQQHQSGTSRQYADYSLNISQKTFGKKHPEVAQSYFNLALRSHEAGKHVEALQLYQRAIIAVVSNFQDTSIYAQPSIREALSDNLLLQILDKKAEAFEDWNAVSKDDKKLLAAYASYDLCTELIEKMRISYKAEGSKLFLSHHSVSIYERAINLSLRLFDLKKDQHYREMAFTFSEKSKAGILRQAMTEAKARRIAGVPDSLLEYEGQLRNELVEYDKQLLKEQKEGGDETKIAGLQNKLLKANHEYERFTLFLEKSYSKYYEHKYQAPQVSIQKVRQQLLGKDHVRLPMDNVTLIEYFVGKETIYIFTASAKDYHVTTVKKDSVFEAQLIGFRAGIVYQVPEVMYNFGTVLYKTLVAPVEQYIVGENVLVVPDAILSTLPFEALIIPDHKKVAQHEYHKINYLLRKYNFCYAYSSTLLMEKEVSTGQPEYEYLGVAPVFASNLKGEKVFSGNGKKEAADVPRDVLVNGHLFSTIPATETEVKEINALFSRKGKNAQVLTREQAREEVIKSGELSKYRYLHFATHGFVSTERPAFSGIIFYGSPDGKEDGVLYAGEIYSLKLNADLVVLSACETGLGKIIKGEGIIGLTRSFLYAGAKNVVVSLWKVADTSTASTMTDFYRTMLKDRHYAYALRKAKLRLLSDKKRAAPYFWAPFIVVI